MKTSSVVVQVEGKEAQLIKNGRLSFPDLFTPSSFGGKNQYMCSILIPKSDTDTIQALRDAVTKAKTVNGQVQNVKPEKVCIQDGDYMEYEGYKGCYVVKTKTYRQPILRDTNNMDLPVDDGTLYAGCYGDFVVDFWFYPSGTAADGTKYPAGVGSNLYAVKKSAGGELLGGGTGDNKTNSADIDNIFGASSGTVEEQPAQQAPDMHDYGF